jgi:hypothetical protein
VAGFALEVEAEMADAAYPMLPEMENFAYGYAVERLGWALCVQG